MRKLATIASAAANAQIDAFSARLADALLARSEQCSDAKEANLHFNAGNLLKQNSYPFFYIASATVERALRQQIDNAEQLAPQRREKSDGELSLVPYEEMDNRVLLSNIARPIEASHSEALVALGIRLANLLQREEMPMSQNPFRTEIFLSAVNDSWREFNPDADAHNLITGLLRPEVFLDLTPVYKAVNDALIARGILPELDDSYRIRKSNLHQDATRSDNKPAMMEQLRNLFSENAGQIQNQAPGNFSSMQDAIGLPQIFSGGMATGAAPQASEQLLGLLGSMQKSLLNHQSSNAAAFDKPNVGLLQSIKKQTPQGAMTRVDENTIDLLVKIFDVIFKDDNIPGEAKALISFLQVPVLKAALIDKEFFFKEEHPARRLINVLSKSSAACDPTKGEADPLYQAMKRNVERVQKDFDQQVSVFADVVTELETFVQEEESLTTTALSEPINKALRQEKLGQARKTAKSEVAMRIGTGEVVAFVETFLESKWVPILTIAYSLEDQQPNAVSSATRTMDDLIWSVKPKITLEDRKQLISKLPVMLAALNKWLNLVKWDDEERLRFFAELSECHASIVRAPIALTPERQLEIAMDVAKKAAERRLEIKANAQPEPTPDEFIDRVENLKGGMWLEFAQKDGTAKKVRLAWISPMRSLFIFTTRDKQESFSVSAEELAQVFRDSKVQVMVLDGMVDRALSQALESVSANDATNEAKTAA